MVLDRKTAITTHKILDTIKNRWSPRAFDNRPISDEELNQLFEAMRWAPSSMNEQPWRIIYARKGEAAYDEIVKALMPGNQVWAKDAPVLMVTLVSKYFSRNMTINKSAQHDLGLAIGNLGIQATALDIGLHQMGGFNPAHIKNTFNINDDFDIVTCIALGYFGDPDSLDEHLKQRELAERNRKPIENFVNHGEFSNQ